VRRLVLLLLTAVAAVVVIVIVRDNGAPRAAIDGRLGAAVSRVREGAGDAAGAVRDRTTGPALAAVRCPAGTDGCVAVRGNVIYVEANDPDGDGDLHVILAGGSVTAPGLSIIKVPAADRPRRVPRVGDAVSAAGVVTKGSRDESELKALVFHMRPR
jgi:hypothetical protein